MEARRGETPQAARCATRTTARPAISQVAGDAHASVTVVCMFQPQRKTTMLWRFSANNTHLYPGAVLRSLDVPGKARLSADDAAAFASDVAAVVGELQPESDPWAS